MQVAEDLVACIILIFLASDMSGCQKEWAVQVQRGKK
jgi:hypothetical protein